MTYYYLRSKECFVSVERINTNIIHLPSLMTSLRQINIYLFRYKLKPNDAILAGDEHKDL